MKFAKGGELSPRPPPPGVSRPPPSGSIVGSTFPIRARHREVHVQRLPVGAPRPSAAQISALATLVALGLGVLPGAPLGAQPTPNGAQFQVNDYVFDNQQSPSVAAGPDGSFVAAWQSWSSPGDDSDQSSVQARLFGASGSPAADQFQLNAVTAGVQEEVAVARAPSGGFVAVWSGPTGEDSADVRARCFDAAGGALGGEFLVNSDTADSQHQPAVGVDPVTGEFLVAWRDDADDSLHARRFDAEGVPVGAQFQVNDRSGSPDWSAIAPLGEGAFVVVWAASDSPGDDPDSSIQARRFGATDAPMGDQFQVNTVTESSQHAAAVAGNGSGGFVVAWASDSSAGDDASLTSIQARSFDAAGAPAGPQSQVNTFTEGYQSQPDVAIDSHGHFLVVWSSEGSAGTDQDSWSIHGRRYDAVGDPVEDEFQVNFETAGDQSSPVVANDAGGDFVVAWQSELSSGTDDSASSIQAERFDDVFREGFESGTLARWSANVPGTG